MTKRSVTHATFDLERAYSRSPAEVFAAWADPVAKKRWFAGPGAEHELDFRVGGHEINRSRLASGEVATFESLYREIQAAERIVYTSVLSVGETVATVSITTVLITPSPEGSRLLLTESGAFLDELELPSWREQGTGTWLDALGADLKTS